MLPLDTEAYMNTRDMTTNSEIHVARKSVHLLVDTGACVSATDEQFPKKTYGDVSLKEGPLYPIAKSIHVKILGLFTHHEQT